MDGFSIFIGFWAGVIVMGVIFAFVLGKIRSRFVEDEEDTNGG